MKEEKVIRFLNKRSTAKESKEVLDYLDQPGSREETEKRMLDKWDNTQIPSLDNNAFYQKLLKKIHKKTIGKKAVKKQWILPFKHWETVRVAASYLLLLFSAYVLYQSWMPTPTIQDIRAEIVQAIERKAKAGEKLKITLPDKTKVIVNSASTIIFDSDFGKTERLITLDGEAYFEVAPGKNKPFKVRTGGVVTTALGTAFNAFSRGGQVEISLTEGKVKVSHNINEVELRPGEKAVLKESSREDIETKTFDPKQATAWKEGKISFTSKPLGEILSTLEEWYGVNIPVQGKVNRNRKVTGIFDNESLEEILKGLSFSLGLEYKINGKTVILKPQGPMNQ